MSVFTSTRQFMVPAEILPAIANEVMDELRHDGFEVAGNALMNGVWDISIARGNMFKAVLGMKSALKVTLTPRGANYMVAEASVGIFGQQAIPTVLAFFVAWPVLITQIWGLVQQSKLDDKVMELIDRSITRRCPEMAKSCQPSGSFCAKCGATLTPGARFCQQCGMQTGVA